VCIVRSWFGQMKASQLSSCTGQGLYMLCHTESHPSAIYALPTAKSRFGVELGKRARRHLRPRLLSLGELPKPASLWPAGGATYPEEKGPDSLKLTSRMSASKNRFYLRNDNGVRCRTSAKERASPGLQPW